MEEDDGPHAEGGGGEEYELEEEEEEELMYERHVRPKRTIEQIRRENEACTPEQLADAAARHLEVDEDFGRVDDDSGSFRVPRLPAYQFRLPPSVMQWTGCTTLRVRPAQMPWRGELLAFMCLFQTADPRVLTDAHLKLLVWLASHTAYHHIIFRLDNALVLQFQEAMLIENRCVAFSLRHVRAR